MNEQKITLIQLVAFIQLHVHLNLVLEMLDLLFVGLLNVFLSLLIVEVGLLIILLLLGDCHVGLIEAVNLLVLGGEVRREF